MERVGCGTENEAHIVESNMHCLVGGGGSSNNVSASICQCMFAETGQRSTEGRFG